jgi:low affinity Fe/Cu permease
MIFDYFDKVAESVEFLIALGSIMGFLMLIVGILGWIFLGQFKRHKMISVVVVAIILLTVCGFSTGIKYFHIY